ncbi:MAG: DUF1570 domain-containing protein [Gemmataceae bacterium]|nr:DUF1570 domain-containing protein [Gemmata sp.]MDW8196794.1 DUF1570 domain-containing protein [Gemmataceae bacterium]
MMRTALTTTIAGGWLILLASLPLPAQPEPPAGLSHWPLEELILKNGARFKGLMLNELPDVVEFQSVYRRPGRPTVTLTSFFSKNEIAEIKRLPPDERAVLKEKLDELDPSGEGERKRMESLELVAADWPGQIGGARQYESDYFILLCTGSEELTRRSAVRLEQIYTAFSRFLPPTVKNASPTVFLLATQPHEYQTLLRSIGGAELLNPAVYDPVRNRIYCGSDLEKLGSDLQSARLHNAQQLADLDRYEEHIKRLYKGEELVRHRRSIAAERKRVYQADVANGRQFDQATRRLFALLYHEAFHAYVAAFVYPARAPAEVQAGQGTGELPRWLNEGLAQIFETAVVEAGELRVDHPDPDRLDRVKSWLKGTNGQKLLPLKDLLTTGKEAFLASHTDQKAASDRAYLSSWALAYYLLFDRRLIGTEAFHKYLMTLNSGANPREAFADLLQTDLATAERQWHDYLLRLRANGTLAK